MEKIVSLLQEIFPFQSSPAVSEKMEVSMTTSVESGPPSDQSTVVDKAELVESRPDPLDTSSSSDQFNTSDLRVRHSLVLYR